MRALILAVTMAMAIASAADAKSCRDTSGKFTKCPPAAASNAGAAAGAAASSGMSSTMAGSAHPHCTKGKSCGNSCIAMNKICHKP